MPLSTFHIRAALQGDTHAIAQLFNAYRQFYDQPDDLPLAIGFIGERIDKRESVILVAQDLTGALLGFTQIYPSYCSVLAAPVGVLYDLFVTPQARRSGVGKALLQAAAEHGRALGLQRLDLTTARTNAKAQSLYASLLWKRDDAFLAYSLDLSLP